jgi:hypothetical protein
MWCKNVWEILPELDPIVACTWFFFLFTLRPTSNQRITTHALQLMILETTGFRARLLVWF